MKKKILAFLLAGAMMLSLAACNSGGNEGGGGGGANADGKIHLTLFNTKSEIQAAMQEMAEAYNQSHDNVYMEIYYSNDTVAAHMATKYASNDPYVISMVDTKDVYSLGPDHAIDLSDLSFVGNTSEAVEIDGKMLGIPICVEGRGLIYNADPIEAITGEPFDPAKYATLDAFKDLIAQLQAGGMENPVGIMKEDWSLAAHFLAEVYEKRPDIDGFIADLQAGNVDLMSDDMFNGLMDFFDVLKENNYAKGSPIAAERETTEMKLAQGEIAFMYGGCWDWAVISAYDYSTNMGIMPVPENTSTNYNTMLIGAGSKYLMIDNTVSEEQQAAAKEFMEWLFATDEGNQWLTQNFAMVPAYSNISAANLDPLGASVSEYYNSGKMFPGYNHTPDDHYSKLGAEMQKYLAGQCSREDLAKAIEAYWPTATLAE